jgi:hypothetical protein
LPRDNPLIYLAGFNLLKRRDIMPYEFVEAEMFLEFRGVKIYHVYKNDMVDEGQHKYWYGLTPRCHEGDRDMFDVRDLARQLNMPEPKNDMGIFVVMFHAIEKGLLTKSNVA